MTASWRGLIVLAAIAAALVIAVVIDLGRSPVVDRAVVPGFDGDRVSELIWERTGQPALRVVRASADAAATGAASQGSGPAGPATAGSQGSGPADRARTARHGAAGWIVHAGGTAPAPADPDAVAEVLAALRGARWHRSGAPSRVRATLAVVSSSGRRTIGIGEPLPGTDQHWLVAGDRGVVVDPWVVRALDRDPLSLRIARPLAEVRAAPSFAINDSPGRAPLRLAGRPRRLIEPIQLAVAPDLVDELERALAEITIVRLPDATGRRPDVTDRLPDGAAGLAITAELAGGSVRAVIGGSCPGAPELIALSATTGDGCIEAAAGQAVRRAADRLRQPPAALAERRPVPLVPERVVLADGATVTTSPPRLDGAAGDPARIAELVAALTAPAEVVAPPGRPAARQLVASDRAGATVTLDVFADRVVARPGEPVALRLAPEAWQVVTRPSRTLRELVLWVEEPTTITELAIDGVRYRRGQVIGAWTRSPAGPVNLAAVEALVEALAAPRAHGFAEPFPPAHRVTIAVTPPVGRPSEHSLELGAPRATGCPARVAGDAVVLPAGVCALALALLQ